MFNRLKLILENNNLKEENLVVHEENKLNRIENEELKLQSIHAKLLAENTIAELNNLERIDRSGNSEEWKKQQRNMIYNELRKLNIDIMKELSNKFGSDR